MLLPVPLGNTRLSCGGDSAVTDGGLRFPRTRPGVHLQPPCRAGTTTSCPATCRSCRTSSSGTRRPTPRRWDGDPASGALGRRGGVRGRNVPEDSLPAACKQAALPCRPRYHRHKPQNRLPPGRCSHPPRRSAEGRRGCAQPAGRLVSKAPN